MRILQIEPSSYEANKGGGVSAYVRNISKRLAKRHDVTVFATIRNGLPRFEVVDGVKVERFKCYAPSRAYAFSLDMPLRIRKVNFDVVHGHSYHTFPMHFSILAKHGRIVVSTHYHGVGHSVFRNCLFSLFRPLGKKTLKKAHKIHAVSEYEKSLLCEQFRLDPDKIIVIPCGLDRTEFEGLKKHKRDCRSILYVGRLVDYKGVQHLVEVLPKLDDNVILEIVGEGDLRTLLENRAKRLNVYDRVRFFQNLSRTGLVQKFVDADVFVLLSRHEAYSMAVAEALAAGTPCIVSQTSALTEWIDGKTCFGIRDPANIDALARLIERVAELKEKTDGRKLRTEKIVDWDDVVERLEQIYKEQ